MNLELIPTGSELVYTSDVHHMSEWVSAAALYETAMLAANRSRATIKLRLHYLRQLRRAHPLSPWSVTTEDLQELMRSARWGPDAMKSARATYRGFYRWAHGSGRLDDDPSLGLQPVGVPAKLPKPTPERIVWDLVRHPDERIEFMGMLAAFLGLRVSEIAVVHENDWDGTRLRVHGKGGKERSLRVHDGTLRSMLNQVRGYAFPNRWTGKPLTAGHVSRLLSQAQPEGWTGHKLRHRAATRAQEATDNIYAVRDMLGHADVKTTQVYTLLSNRALDAALAGASGVDVA